MKLKKYIALALIFCVITPIMAQYNDKDVAAYVEKYKEYAINAMEKYKIPASIKLAQAIYSSACGTNFAATEANNHFGIMCRGGWTGETFYYEGDPNDMDHCFRKYPSVEASYQNHSAFLATRERYADLFKLEITDYKGWANGLLKDGYASNPNYPQKLINIIEKYHLDQYDYADYDGGVMAEPQEVAHKEIPQEEPVKVEEVTTAQPTETTPAMENLQATPKEQPKEEVKEETKEPENEIEVIYVNFDSRNENNQAALAAAENRTATEKPIEKKEVSNKPVKMVNNLPAPDAQIITTIFCATKDDYRQIYYPYTQRPVYENNKTSFIIARTGDTYAKIAQEVKINETNLRAYNDIYDEQSQPINGEVIYLEPKNTKSIVNYHIMKEGESFRFLSQKYAVQLKVLLKRNGYAPGAFGVGDKICISCK